MNPDYDNYKTLELSILNFLETHALLLHQMVLKKFLELLHKIAYFYGLYFKDDSQSKPHVCSYFILLFWPRISNGLPLNGVLILIMNLARTPTPSDLEKHDYRKFVSPGCLDCQGLFFLQTLVVKELQGMDIYIFIDVHKQ